jgi:hypothetical protein
LLWRPSWLAREMDLWVPPTEVLINTIVTEEGHPTVRPAGRDRESRSPGEVRREGDVS